MRRMEARRRKASALREIFSQSLASRRQRLNQAKLRSTTHRRGRTSKPLAGVGALDDLYLDPRQNLRQRRLKLWPLVAAIGKQNFEKRKQPEQRRDHEHTTITILDIRRMNHGI